MPPSDPKNTDGKKKSSKATKRQKKKTAVPKKLDFEPETQPSSEDESTSAPPLLGFPIVGLGASAGGLEALNTFLEHTPSELNMAMVVVMHQDPDKKSQLVPLLQHRTSLPVLLAMEKQEPSPGQIYVCPPGRHLTLSHGKFHLDEPKRGLGPVSIDTFFYSLALEQETMCAGVVLSGTGRDGARGVAAIKESGGLVIAQEEGSAAYEGMPLAAQSTGKVDHVLPPDEIPQALVDHFGIMARLANGEKNAQTFQEAAKEIYHLIKVNTGHDFSAYKERTMRRRVEKRMGLHHMESFAQYVGFLRGNRAEAQALFAELLIGVTSFFRDPKAFEALKEKALLPMLDSFEPGQTFRAWVAGCSTGEEAYSLAILLWECVNQLRRDVNLQIFATDIDTESIAKARAGIFPESIASVMEPDRLSRFFNRETNCYRAKKEIRDSIIFSVQDLMRDPPFSRLDLLSCRNLLIYLKLRAQQKLMPLFHYTLRPGGLLFLGSSESIGRFPELFEVVDYKWKIYRRMDLSIKTRPEVEFPTGIPFRTIARNALLPADEEDFSSVASDWVALRIRDVLLEEFVPGAVLVDGTGEILHVHGHTGKYLEPAPGPSRMNVIAMARKGLRGRLTELLTKASEKMTMQKAGGLRVLTNGGYELIDLTVRPVVGYRKTRPLFLVVFQDAQEVAPEPSPENQPPHEDAAGNLVEGKNLEEELRISHETLETMVEELETSNEELKATNEELQSTNEELQSTNEELESSKEELQSMNEELTTVNNEMQAKVDELSRIQDDMCNILNSTNIATLFVSEDLIIRRFTPEVTKLIHLIETDVGRPLDHISSRLREVKLEDFIRRVSRTLETLEQEVITEEDKWYQMRVMPYRTTDNVIDGVVITFSDISAQKLTELSLKEHTEFMDNLMNTLREPLMVLDEELKVIMVNRSFYLFFQVAPQETVNYHILDMGSGQWDVPDLIALLKEMITQKGQIDDFVVEGEFPRIGFKRLKLNARRMAQPGSSKGKILLAMQEAPNQA